MTVHQMTATIERRKGETWVATKCGVEAPMSEATGFHSRITCAACLAVYAEAHPDT